MSPELWALVGTAGLLGLVHTLIGPDHYVPFIVMGKARNWSVVKTAWITLLCGIGHVGSSVVLGFVGIAAGVALAKLEWFEGFRGDIAAWLLTVFGFLYLVWGIRRAVLNRPHKHLHMHDGEQHEHDHTHTEGHAHAHTQPNKVNITPWILFTIFVFGPCEPLIPLLMFPAAQQSVFGIVVVSVVFSVATIGTMMAIVMGATFGLKLTPLHKLERYTHALAGGAILACGVLIHLGL